MNKVTETVLILGSALIAVALIVFGVYILNAHDENVEVIVEEVPAGEQGARDDEGLSEKQVPETIVTFTINTQDFSYPEKSAETLSQLLELHETYNIPLSISFTHAMIDYYSQEQPELWERLANSPLMSFGYHIRPPLPYHSSTPHSPGTESLTDEELQDYILSFETHGLDLETGISTQEPGGFGLLVDLLGDRPYTVGVSVDDRLRKVLEVYADLGAAFFAGYTGEMWLGERIGPLHVRPEQEEIKAFERTDEDPEEVLRRAIEGAPMQEGVPTFVNVKMHDNDFFAEQSAWTAVYLSAKSRRLGAPFDLSQASVLLETEQQEEIWMFYEDLLKTVAEDGDLATMSVEGVQNLLK